MRGLDTYQATGTDSERLIRQRMSTGIPECVIEELHADQGVENAPCDRDKPYRDRVQQAAEFVTSIFFEARLLIDTGEISRKVRTSDYALSHNISDRPSSRFTGRIGQENALEGRKGTDRPDDDR